MRRAWILPLTVFLIWFLSTVVDRLWWSNCEGTPAWDQADYLNSALEHGRALGIMHDATWQGWTALLDLSPKIPPLASLINGVVMAIAGDTPKQAAWSLSIWNGILLAVIAAWGYRLCGKKLALLAVLFLSLAPGLLSLRTDYVLELPLTTTTSLALWRLGCWGDPRTGGAWSQALVSAFTIAVALLVKQSALLVLLIPCLFTACCRWHYSSGRPQILVGLGIISISVLPWLQHNWVTFLGGTSRAIIQSASREGDPSPLSLDSWIWYLKLFPYQVGLTTLSVGLAGLLLLQQYPARWIGSCYKSPRNFDDTWSWRWLILSLLSGWVLTTLSPNKDPRYIAPLLPLLILTIARGWLELGFWLQRASQHTRCHVTPVTLLALGLIPILLIAYLSQRQRLARACRSGLLTRLIEVAGGADPGSLPSTLIVVPSTPDINQHNISFYGRRAGGQLVGRQLGGSSTDIKPVLERANWVVLAEGDQGSVQLYQVIQLDAAVRSSGIFFRVAVLPQSGKSSYSLWRRRKNYYPSNSFENYFPRLATGLAQGPIGLAAVFDAVAIEHMLDGHRRYRVLVKNVAQQRLTQDPTDLESLWSLALLAVLDKRPAQASARFRALQQLYPDSAWPAAYASATSLAAWNPWQARAIAAMSLRQHQEPILIALADLSSVFSGAVWRLPAVSSSLPNAVRYMELLFAEQKRE